LSDTQNSKSKTIGAYLSKLAVERRLSEHTIKAYRRDLNKLLNFADQRSALLWHGLNQHFARLFSADLFRSGLSPKSIQRILSAQRGFCAYLVQQGELENNPFVDIKGPKQEKRLPKTLSADQVTSLVEINAQDPLSYRDKAILELFYSSGLRLAELCALNLVDLMLGEATVRVTGKGNKTRELPIGKHALSAIKEWLKQRALLPIKDHNAVFISKLGNRISPRTIQQRVAMWAKKQGIDVNVSPHMLRHSFASHMLESSGELRVIQELLGHSNISTTQIYTHLVYDDAHPRAKKKPT